MDRGGAGANCRLDSGRLERSIQASGKRRSRSRRGLRLSWRFNDGTWQDSIKGETAAGHASRVGGGRNDQLQRRRLRLTSSGSRRSIAPDAGRYLRQVRGLRREDSGCATSCQTGGDALHRLPKRLRITSGTRRTGGSSKANSLTLDRCVLPGGHGAVHDARRRPRHWRANKSGIRRHGTRYPGKIQLHGVQEHPARRARP